MQVDDCRNNQHKNPKTGSTVNGGCGDVAHSKCTLVLGGKSSRKHNLIDSYNLFLSDPCSSP